MNELKIFKNGLFEVGVTLEDGSVLFDAETVAQSLGFTQTQNKNGKLYTSTRWETINAYLEKYFPNKLGKGDLIPESMVYKLAFKASNDTAEKFQDWLAIEVIPEIRKTGSFQSDISNLPPELQLMNALVQQINTQALNQLKLETAVQETKEEIQAIRDAIVINPKAEWRKETNNTLNKIGKKLGDYSAPRNEAYEALKDRARCKPTVLIGNLKKRALENGMQPSKVEGINILDVLENDIRLREIYISIVKEMAIKKGVA